MHMSEVVALLAEGVDRNHGRPLLWGCGCAVALLAEGVDRNVKCFDLSDSLQRSPSSRRAWIEILLPRRSSGQ